MNDMPVNLADAKLGDTVLYRYGRRGDRRDYRLYKVDACGPKTLTTGNVRYYRDTGTAITRSDRFRQSLCDPTLEHLAAFNTQIIRENNEEREHTAENHKLETLKNEWMESAYVVIRDQLADHSAESRRRVLGMISWHIENWDVDAPEPASLIQEPSE